MNIPEITKYSSYNIGKSPVFLNDLLKRVAEVEILPISAVI